MGTATRALRPDPIPNMDPNPNPSPSPSPSPNPDQVGTATRALRRSAAMPARWLAAARRAVAAPYALVRGDISIAIVSIAIVSIAIVSIAGRGRASRAGTRRWPRTLTPTLTPNPNPTNHVRRDGCGRATLPGYHPPPRYAAMDTVAAWACRVRGDAASWRKVS